MEYIGALVIGIIIFIAIFLLLREVNMWYWKINERIALMQEQNNLLRKLISGSVSQERVESDTIIEKPIEKPTAETITHTAPKIVSQNKTNESSSLKGSFENIHLEFSDGIKGSIFHNPAKNEYYFKDKSQWNAILHYYDNFENCVNAFHYFETTKQILKVGFAGSFS
ncbi:MAG: hypothetical protein RBQ64_06930 [Candidatus Izemoplasmatales bacterium]|jgi:hypothetical protein|nr:hypothetical protein [Candidatus Izemoplasmatales bacterium]